MNAFLSIRTAIVVVITLLLFSGHSQESKNVETKLPDWQRSNFEAGGGNAFVMYVIYGSFTNQIKFSASKYRTAGVPTGVTIKKISRKEGSPLPFVDGPFGKQLEKQNATLFTQITNAPECMVIRGKSSIRQT